MPKLITERVCVIISILQVRKQKNTKVLRLAGKALSKPQQSQAPDR